MAGRSCHGGGGRWANLEVGTAMSPAAGGAVVLAVLPGLGVPSAVLPGVGRGRAGMSVLAISV
ncbi:hypothetical protein [Streptomyces sp. NPDC021622]|uniref:hypothetical protein n=1 Tax=Streptomyces sp. NPDC021622 TaxID=3155013 RepID=UPI0033D6A0ED